uniref:Endonuclease/exonuclease/phosphatase domain-containing protein n=1 Tax=Cuerna arida TaxID=1464854 RepID=A0A1B6GB84_9HEMI
MGDRLIALNTQGYFDADIQSFSDRHRPLSLSVTEHKQSDLRNLEIDGYRVASGHPSSQRGSAVLVRDDVSYRPRRDLDSFSRDRLFEVSSVEYPSHNTVQTAIYRSPNSSKTEFNRQLDDFCGYLRETEPHKKHVIGGDWNIDRNRNTVTKQVLEKHDFQFNLRGSTHDGGRCIDNFATDFQPAKSRVMRNYSLSDHRPIEMHLPKSSSSRRRR